MILTTGAQAIDGHKENRLLSTQTQAAFQGNPGHYPGKANREKRFHIYDYCIKNMVKTLSMLL